MHPGLLEPLFSSHYPSLFSLAYAEVRLLCELECEHTHRSPKVYDKFLLPKHFSPGTVKIKFEIPQGTKNTYHGFMIQPFFECEGGRSLYIILAHVLPHGNLSVPRKHSFQPCPGFWLFVFSGEPETTATRVLWSKGVVLQMKVHKIIHSVLLQFLLADGRKCSLHAPTIYGRHEEAGDHLVNFRPRQVNFVVNQCADRFQASQHDSKVNDGLSLLLILLLFRLFFYLSRK